MIRVTFFQGRGERLLERIIIPHTLKNPMTDGRIRLINFLVWIGSPILHNHCIIRQRMYTIFVQRSFKKTPAPIDWTLSSLLIHSSSSSFELKISTGSCAILIPQNKRLSNRKFIKKFKKLEMNMREASKWNRLKYSLH